MTIKRKKTSDSNHVTASEVAQMGVCERRIVFDAANENCPKPLDATTRAALQTGTNEHLAYHRAACELMAHAASGIVLTGTPTDPRYPEPTATTLGPLPRRIAPAGIFASLLRWLRSIFFH